VGGIMPFGASAAPTGFLLCDGGAVSRTTYAALFGVIGTTYGTGNGTTTFTLPDLRGKFPLGSSSGHALGSAGGSETTTLSSTNLPAHTHGMSAVTVASGGAHSHTLSINSGASRSFVYDLGARSIYAGGGANGAFYGSSSAGDDHVHSGTANADVGHAHSMSGTSDSTGTGTAATTLSPFQTVNYVIKV
jgi:microcystin-dependent protein